jgi:hypothetical protein
VNGFWVALETEISERVIHHRMLKYNVILSNVRIH